MTQEQAEDLIQFGTLFDDIPMHLPAYRNPAKKDDYEILLKAGILEVFISDVRLALTILILWRTAESSEGGPPDFLLSEYDQLPDRFVDQMGRSLFPEGLGIRIAFDRSAESQKRLKGRTRQLNSKR